MEVSPSMKPLCTYIGIALVAAVSVTLVDEQRMACFLYIGLLAFPLAWTDILPDYKCRDCRNTLMVDYNVQHYQPYDSGVVDVPDRFTEKRCIDDHVLVLSRYV